MSEGGSKVENPAPGVERAIIKDAPSSEASPGAKPGKIGRRGFLGMMAGVAGAIGLGAFAAGHELAKTSPNDQESTPAANPTPDQGTEDFIGVPQDPLENVARSEAPPSPALENPVPADNPDSGNVYAKGIPGQRSDGTLPPIDPNDPDAVPQEEPIKIDDNNRRGPDGEDIIIHGNKKDPNGDIIPGPAAPVAMVDRAKDATEGPLPVPPDPNKADPLPMMPRKEPDVVAQMPRSADAEANPPLPPSENQSEPLPKRSPRDDDPVNA